MGRKEDREKARERQKREKSREKKEKDLCAVTVERMKEGARASLFRKLKKGTNSHSGNDERERDKWKKRERQKNVMREWNKEKKGNGRVWLEDGNCTQSAFRENVLMHWNSLFESATMALVIGTSPLASQTKLRFSLR